MTFSPPRTLARGAKFAPHRWPLALFLGYSAVFGVCASPVLSQNAPSTTPNAVTVALQAFKVARTPDGKEQLQNAVRAKPGDILEYRAVYANVSRKEVKNLQATLPIPASTEVLLDSASPQTAMVSADGRTFAPAPIMRAVRMPDGTIRNRPLPNSAYRALRWPIGILAPGKSVTVRARVRLNATLSAN